MSREAMMVAIEEMTPGDGLTVSLDEIVPSGEWMKAREKWLQVAKEDWIDILLALVANPPPPSERCWDWDGTARDLLEQLAQKFPQPALAKISALLPSADRVLRPYLIWGIGATFLPQTRAALQPFVDSIESLPLPELAALADALPLDGEPERIQILRRIRDAIPAIQDEEHDEMREDVEFHIAYTQKRLDEKGGSQPTST